MKLKVINFDSKNVYGSIKQAVFTSALSYGKMYELLHKQLWRKAPYRIGMYSHPHYPTHNGRPVVFISSWNIIDGSRAPYDYNGGNPSFGLDQLFMGQDYRKQYVGDPKDGIYHDTCIIVPRTIKSLNSTAWGYKSIWIYSYADGEGIDASWTRDLSRSWIREDNEGNVLIDNVEIVTDVVTVNNVATYTKKIVVHYHNGTINEVTLGSFTANTADEIIYGSTKDLVPDGPMAWYKFGEDMSAHGSIVHEESRGSFFTNTWNFVGTGWIRFYEDGTVVEFTPTAVKYTKDAGSRTMFSPTYKILPMLYTDTGDLVMDRVEFVDKWNEYFELIVIEDSEWWSGLIRPVSLIVAAIIIYCSWGTLSPLAKAIVVIGYAVYAVGVITNNTDLMLIGGIMMAGVSIYTAVETATTTTASTAAELSTVGTEQALASTSFTTTFEGYASAAGMENLVVMPTVESYTSLTLEGLATTPYAELGSMSLADSYAMANISAASSFGVDSLMTIGKELYSAYSKTNQLLNGSTSTSSSTSATSDESGMRITVKSSDEEDDVMQYIKKVIEI